jgi:hypothetical protein
MGLLDLCLCADVHELQGRVRFQELCSFCWRQPLHTTGSQLLVECFVLGSPARPQSLTHTVIFLLRLKWAPFMPPHGIGTEETLTVCELCEVGTIQLDSEPLFMESP